MRLIQADSAWAKKKFGSSGVTVAIIDTGLDYDSYDLNTLVDLNRSASFATSWVGDTSSTLAHPDTLTISDAEISRTLYPNRNVISDFNGHGTNVATQVSSRAFGFAGVTSKTTLIGVKVLGRNGQGTFGQILNGVLFAADHHADVANMSLGGGFSKAGNGRLLGVINKVFNYAKQQGMLIVVSAGNDGQDLQHNGNVYASFCDSPHVVCVSAVGPTTWEGNGDAPAFYTTFGKTVVSIAAPGGNGIPEGNSLKVTPGWPWGDPPEGNDIASWVFNICSKTVLVIHGKTGNFGNLVDTGCRSGLGIGGEIGTSQASPHVSGLAALLIAENGKGQPQLIKRLIERSADPINPALGQGRINVKKALGL
jgi:subtilisin family serine protease